MKAKYWGALAFAATLGLAAQADATVVRFSVSGDGYSAAGLMTVTPNTAPPASDGRTDPPGSYAITGISGTFSDAADGISNAAITGLIATNPGAERGPFDPLVPASLSWVDYAPATQGAFSYDNLFFPAGSPVDCTDFQVTGTFLDDLGTAFTVDGGYLVNLWGDGDLLGPGTTAYGVKVVQGANLLSTSFSGLSGAAVVPEPSTWALMLLAFAGLGARLRGRRARPAPAAASLA